MEHPSKDGKFIQATAAYGRAHTTVERIERKEKMRLEKLDAEECELLGYSPATPIPHTTTRRAISFA